MQRKEAKMDVAFRATQAGFAEGHKDGRQDGAPAAYDAGYSEGYKDGRQDGAPAAHDAGYSEGYKDGRQDGAAAAYDAGWADGYETGEADARRSAPTESDLWSGVVDEALDRLTRHFDAALPDVANALRAVRADYNHPSRIWDAPPAATLAASTGGQ